MAPRGHGFLEWPAVPRRTAVPTREVVPCQSGAVAVGSLDDVAAVGVLPAWRVAGSA